MRRLQDNCLIDSYIGTQHSDNVNQNGCWPMNDLEKDSILWKIGNSEYGSSFQGFLYRLLVMNSHETPSQEELGNIPNCSFNQYLDSLGTCKDCSSACGDWPWCTETRCFRCKEGYGLNSNNNSCLECNESIGRNIFDEECMCIEGSLNIDSEGLKCSKIQNFSKENKEFTVTGVNFPEDESTFNVTIGPNNCAVTQNSDASITCQLPEIYEAGEFQIAIQVNDYGPINTLI